MTLSGRSSRDAVPKPAPSPAPRSRFSEAVDDRPPLDKIDVVLGEWAKERPEATLAPVAITARVSRLAQILQERMERRSARFGLDWGQFLVLATLRGAGSPFRMSPRELHRLLLLSPAAVTNRLYRLEVKGLIERTSDPTDGRSMPVVLTTLGLSTIDRAMAACLEGDRELLTGLNPADLETTIRTLRRLLAAYEEYPVRRRSRRDATLATRTAAGVAADPGTSRAAVPATVTPKPQRWPSTAHDLERLQRKLARQVEEADPWAWTGTNEPAIGGVFVSLPRTRAGDDARDIAWAAVVIMEAGKVVATATATRRLMQPYEPGYLALTVGPILEDVVRTLSQPPNLIMVNAAGRDHIRGAGLAIQLGAALDTPTVGVTDRPDVGVGTEPGSHRGDWTPVRIENRVVGFRVRTFARGKSIMAHAAWLTTPETARNIVIRSTGRTRIPAPLQRARQLARRLRSEYESAAGAGLQDGIHGHSA